MWRALTSGPVHGQGIFSDYHEQAVTGEASEHCYSHGGQSGGVEPAAVHVHIVALCDAGQVRGAGGCPGAGAAGNDKRLRLPYSMH